MIKINTGDLPSAEGLDGYQLSVVVGKWQAIASYQFRKDCTDLLKMIDETERFKLWEKNCGGFTYKSRDDFLQNKVLIDYDLTEQSLAEIVARLRGGEQVNLVLRDGPGAPEGNQNAKKDKGENNLPMET
jgi:hypothetical protein